MARRATRYERRRRGSAWPALAGVFGLLAAAGVVRWWLGTAPNPVIGGNFALVASDGRAVTQSSFDHHALLIYFGYSACDDVCPQTLTQLSEALDRLGPLADRIQPLFITVDPHRDTPERLRHYLSAFSPRLIGLTGSPAQLARVEREFHVVSRHGAVAPDGSYDVDHSSVLYLVASDGQPVRLLPADAQAPALAESLRGSFARSPGSW